MHSVLEWHCRNVNSIINTFFTTGVSYDNGGLIKRLSEVWKEWYKEVRGLKPKMNSPEHNYGKYGRSNLKPDADQ